MTFEPGRDDESDFWNLRSWHHTVHQHLGETLHYYFAKLRPFDIPKAVQSLKELTKKHRLGSIRVFYLIGPYDLLIRIWSHTAVAEEMRDLLTSVLGPAEPLCPFLVRVLPRRWYWEIDSNIEAESRRDLLLSLNDHSFKEVQDGGPRSPQLRKSLLEKNLIVTHVAAEEPMIKFFVAVNLKSDGPELKEEIVRTTLGYLDDNRTIRFASVYTGWGFFSILVNAQVAVKDFFEIGKFGHDLTTRYRTAGASTETYLVGLPGYIFKHEPIGQSTFSAIHGVDLFVNGIIPELYQHEYPHAAVENIEQFLRREAQHLPLTKRVTKIIHDYVLAYLAKDEITMATTLMALFMAFESYLNSTYKEFVGRYANTSLKVILREVAERESKAKGEVALRESTGGADDDQGIKSSNRVALWTLLLIFSVAIQRSEREESADLAWRWETVAEVRNGLAHLRYNLLDDWWPPLSVALQSLPRMRDLIELVESITGKPYTGIR